MSSMNRKKFITSTALAMGSLLYPNTGKPSAFEKSSIKLTVQNDPQNVIIIGSGYGGAVAALRLAEKGIKVTLLEMGLNWEKAGIPFSSMLQPGKSAAWLRTRTIAPFMNVFPLQKFTGALDRWDFKHIKVWMGRGVGGGSLVNGGMAVVPRRDYFEEIFPTLDADAFYNKYFPLAEKELHVNTANEDFLNDCKYYKFNRVGEAEAHNAGFKTVRVPNVYDFNYMEKECRDEVPKSALAGEVIYGNNHGKSSLDKNYLKKALATGNLEIFDLHQVERIIQAPNDTYTLEVSVLDTSGNIVDKKVLLAHKLFLCAGTMGTLELLLRSGAEGHLSIDKNVGETWGNNGNFMTGRNWVKAFAGGTGHQHSTIPVGGIDNWDDREHPFFTEIAPLPMGMDVATTLYLMINRVKKFGSVSYDTTSQKIKLNWNRSHTREMQKNASWFIKKMNRINGGTRSHLLFHNGWGYDVCYHPLGGAVLEKATNRYGKLNGHKNLFVLDGSLIPGTTGVNPFLTITAVAEYCMEHILAEENFKV